MPRPKSKPATKLDRLIADRGWTYQEVADRCGMTGKHSRKVIWWIAKGKRRATGPQMLAIAKAMRRSVERIFG